MPQALPRKLTSGGVEFAKQGNFKKAKVQFEQALRLDPSFFPARSSLRTVDEVLKGKIKTQAGVHFFRGVSYGNRGQHDRAIEEFTRAIKLNPNHPDTYYDRGIIYDRRGQPDLAIRDYTRAIKINPRFVLAFLNRGNNYLGKKQYDRAIADFTRAIEINPKYAEAYSNRGFVYINRIRDRAKGCKDYKKACELGVCRNYKIAKQKGLCR